MAQLKTFLLMLWSGLMVALGVFVALKADNTDTEITNHVGKIKGNSGAVDISQTQPVTEPKKGLFKRIFKRKNK